MNTEAKNRILEVCDMVSREVASAMSKHKPYNSPHEAYAVILEELDEFWEIVRMQSRDRNKDDMRKELVQVACTAVRAVIDLGLLPERPAYVHEFEGEDSGDCG